LPGLPRDRAPYDGNTLEAFVRAVRPSVKEGSIMDELHVTPPDPQLQFLRELQAEAASIDDDVLEMSKDLFAIHGIYPYDGEIPMAVFETYDDAIHALEEVRRPTGSTSGR
jgi:hypothetical protein